MVAVVVCSVALEWVWCHKKRLHHVKMLSL